MTNSYPLPRQTRDSDVLLGTGVAEYGPFDFEIFDIQDVEVLQRSVGADSWGVAATLVEKVANQPFDFFTVTFPVPIDTTTEYRVIGKRLHERSTDLTRGGSIKSDELEKETSKQGVVLQEVRRDINSMVAGFERAEAAADAAEEARDEVVQLLDDATQLATPGDGTVRDIKVADDAGIKSSKISFLSDRDAAEPLSVFKRLNSQIHAVDFDPDGAFSTNSNVGPAIQKAIDACAAQGYGIVHLPAGNYIHSHIECKVGVRLVGENTQLSPSAAMSEQITITGGVTGIKGVSFVNTGNLADHAILANKAWPSQSNYPILVADNFFLGYGTAYSHSEGDCAYIVDNFSQNCGLFAHFLNNGVNSRIFKNHAFNGNGIYFQKQSQGVEGAIIHGNSLFPAAVGTFAIRMESALEVTIADNTLDQLFNGACIVLAGDSSSINTVKIHRNWMGRNGGASGAEHGLLMTGNCFSVHSSENTYTGFQTAGIESSGPGGRDDFQSLSDIFFRGDRCVRDMTLENTSALINGTRFASLNNSINELGGVTGRVTNCSFADSIRPATVLAGLKYGAQKDGMVLKNKGAVNIPAPGTGVPVLHGLDYQPLDRDFAFTVLNYTTNDPGPICPLGVSATSVTVSPRNNPGNTLTVGWRVDMER